MSMECSECAAVLPVDARFCLHCGARVQIAPIEAADPLRDALERAIGFQYRIERLLGRGGMGAVYLAHELALDRDVAIKVLPPEHAGTPQMRARFKHEARTAARLTHPNIVPLHTFGEVDGLMYFVMGYVSGESLAARLQREAALPPDTSRTLLVDLAGALEYAHRHGVVHRDLKPDNVLIDGESGAPLLTDFGISKAATGGGQLTMTGQVIGTADYMSPEQARGQSDVDARSDLYSLGVMAYEMVTGRRPFEASSLVEALTKRLTQDPPSLRSVANEAPDDLVVVVNRCLQRNPDDRWPDARTLRAALASADDHLEDPLPVRLLKVGVSFFALACFASIYLGILRRPAAGIGSIIGLGVPALVVIAAASIMVKRQQIAGRSLLHLALVQPRWWRFWYPKTFRRRGDVWDRLPRPIRRMRIQMTVGICLFIGVVVPMQIAFLANHTYPTIRIALELLIFAWVAFVIVSRTRATRYVAKTLGVKPAEASQILSAKSWQTTVWQSGPALALLRGATAVAAPPRPSSVADAHTMLTPSRVDRSNEVTRL